MILILYCNPFKRIKSELGVLDGCKNLTKLRHQVSLYDEFHHDRTEKT